MEKIHKKHPLAKIGSFLLCLLMSTQLGAQEGNVTAQANVDRDLMGPGDTFTLTISVESQGSVELGNPVLPDLTGFNILQRWTSSEVSAGYDSEKGQYLSRRKQIYNYQLQAPGPGKYKIGAASVSVGDQELLTKPIEIAVKEGVPPPQPGNNRRNPIVGSDPDDLFDQLLRNRGRLRRGAPPTQGNSRDLPGMDPNDAFFLELDVDKEQVYVGEQIIATYYLLTRGQVSDIDTLKYPTLAGFWKEDIELATRLNFKPEIINGQRYNKALLASYALFPINSGDAVIDTYKAKCTIVNFNPFGLPGSRKLTKESRAVDIKVMPLPKQGQPVDFAGAVGKFEVSSSLDKNSTKIEEPISFRVRFEGRGNGKLIELPKIKFPPQLEVYNSKSQSKYFKDGRSFKEFEYLLVPRQTGQVVIPEVKVSLFDASTKAYYSIQTQPQQLEILPGEQGERMASNPLAVEEKEKPQGPVWPSPLFAAETPVKWWASWSAYVWGGLYGSTSLGFLAWAAITLGWGKPRESLRRKTRARLKSIRALMAKENYRSVGVETVNLVGFVLGEVAETGGGSLEVDSLLAKAPPSFRNTHGKKLVQMLKSFESMAFAPESESQSLAKTVVDNRHLEELEEILLKATELEFDDEGGDS